jgi:uncharacterized protein YecT (DUF1311 family)
MNNLRLIVVVLLLSSISNAEPYVYENGSYKFKANNIDECYNLGSSSPNLHVCQNHFNDIGKNKLNSSYTELLSKLTRDKNKLIDSQNKWLEFAASQCNFEAQASEAYSKPYNAYTEIYNSCHNTLSINRAKYLNSIDSGCAACVK